MELVTNTREFDYSLTNRLLVKKGGSVNGCSVGSCGKSAISTATWAALSPASTVTFSHPDTHDRLRLLHRAQALFPHHLRPPRQPPAQHRRGMARSSLPGSFRHERYFISAGHNHVRSVPQLSPNSNQFLGILGWGNSSERGWSIGFQSVYDFRLGIMQFATT